METPKLPKAPEIPQHTVYHPVIINSEGFLTHDPYHKPGPGDVPVATLTDENPIKQRLYSDKRCSVRFCRDSVQWRIVKASEVWSDDPPVMPGGPVDDSLTAQLEFAEGSVKHRPTGTLVEDKAQYMCERHYREQEKRLLDAASAAAAELVSKRNTANPYLWSLDPTGVRVELKVDNNFLLVFPDGFEMVWEGMRVDELNRWRVHGRRLAA
jgi:hypothetical protein